jgi:hypothetical protein
MPISPGIRVEGLREVQKAFRDVDKSLVTSLGGELKRAAEPVVASAKTKVARFQGASVGTIRAVRSGPNVYVEQSARKVTGLRGDFGSLQMRTVLEPALDENENRVFAEVERVLDKYADGAGF